jgi:hypothetical protein
VNQVQTLVAAAALVLLSALSKSFRALHGELATARCSNANHKPMIKNMSLALAIALFRLGETSDD